MPIGMQGSGGLPRHSWRGVFELPFLEFRERRLRTEDPHRFAEWMSEAAKRCGIPFLALNHALFAIGLVLSLASAAGRASVATTTPMLAIPTIHVAILVAAETLVRHDPWLIFVVVLAIVAELAAAILERQNANFALAKEPATPLVR
jgi:lipopolysaccharide export system permease protein